MPTSQSIRSVRLLLIFFFLLASLYYISRSYSRIPYPPTSDSFQPGGRRPAKPPSQFPIPAGPANTKPQAHNDPQTGKVKAAFVTLVRNGELWDMVRSIRQVEDRFNRNYHYPWIFMNDEPFTDEFMDTVSAMTSGKAKFGTTRLPSRACNSRVEVWELRLVFGRC